MYNKLIVAKTKFFMNNEDRKQLSADMADMMLNGALVVGDEIDQLLILNVDTGQAIPIKAKEQKPKEELSHVGEKPEEKKRYSSKDIFEMVKKVFSKKSEEERPPVKKYF